MTANIFQPEWETLSRERYREIQDEKVAAVVKWAYEHTDFYRNKFTELGLEPEDIRSVEDLAKIPSWKKEEYRNSQGDKPPFGGLLGVPREELRMVCMGSGTTGNVSKHPFTYEDLEVGADVVARALYAVGAANPGWIFYDVSPQGLHFGWSHIFRRGAEKAQMAVCAGDFLEHPVTGIERRLDFLASFRPEFIAGGTPNVAQIGHLLAKNGIPNPFKKIWAGGDSGIATMPEKRAFMETLFPGADVHDIIGPMDLGVFYGFECGQKDGMHVPEDHVLLEILAAESDTPVRDGDRGRVVVTTLSKKSFPLIRFDMEDISTIQSRGECPCGRTNMRTGGTIGRSTDLVAVRDRLLLPWDIERNILQDAELTGEFQILRQNKPMKSCVVKLETNGQAKSADLAKRMSAKLAASLEVPVDVTLVTEGTLATKSYKQPRIVSN